jgi:hypothetical protein
MKHRSSRIPRAPGPSIIEYKGPIPMNTAEVGVAVLLRDVVTLNTGAGTSFSSQLDNNPSSVDNWSEYQTSWNEYRVLGIRFHFVPGPAVNSATVVVGPMAHSIVHSVTAPSNTTLAETLSYGDSQLGHTTKPFTCEWRMAGADEARFSTTSSPALSSYTLLTFADTLTTATAYGAIYRTWYIQFRNARK